MAVLWIVVAFVWRRGRQVPVRECLLFVFLAIRHVRSFISVFRIRLGPSNGLLVKTRPEVLEFIYSPYVASSWSAPQRIHKIANHCSTIRRIGGILDFEPDCIVDVLRLDPIATRYRITLDQARWLLSDGQLVISLWEDVDRLYSLSFCLSSEGAKLRACIGGIQGREGAGVLDRYRQFTKQSYGMRPRDFLIEIFKIFCRVINVTEIHAVSDQNRPSHERMDSIDKFKTRYDLVWCDRGGVIGPDGFFTLPLAAYSRKAETIPPRKRTMYRNRHRMMSAIEAMLASEIEARA